MQWCLRRQFSRVFDGCAHSTTHDVGVLSEDKDAILTDGVLADGWEAMGCGNATVMVCAQR